MTILKHVFLPEAGRTFCMVGPTNLATVVLLSVYMFKGMVHCHHVLPLCHSKPFFFKWKKNNVFFHTKKFTEVQCSVRTQLWLGTGPISFPDIVDESMLGTSVYFMEMYSSCWRLMLLWFGTLSVCYNHGVYLWGHSCHMRSHSLWWLVTCNLFLTFTGNLLRVGDVILKQIYFKKDDFSVHVWMTVSRVKTEIKKKVAVRKKRSPFNNESLMESAN